MKNFDVENAAALAEPKPGDYWHEMFSPYFIVVAVKQGKISILQDTIHENGGFHFDLDTVTEVDSEWLQKRVRYQLIDGFVADCVNTENTRKIADNWREHHAQKLKNAIATAEKEWEEFTGWTTLQQEEFN